MYETMTVYPISRLYHLSFIFLSAFAFLNMVIGIVVGVLDQEHKRLAQETNPKSTIRELQQKIGELKLMVATLAEEYSRRSPL
jgi:voltage-gated sodium channel